MFMLGQENLRKPWFKHLLRFSSLTGRCVFKLIVGEKLVLFGDFFALDGVGCQRMNAVF